MIDVSIMLKSLCISFGLTVLLEWAIGLPFKLKRADVGLFLLVNLLTNPAVVFLNTVLRGFFPDVSSFLWQIPAELAVIAVEGLIYTRLSRTLRMPRLYAAVANVFSYTVGLFINLIIQF